jgi:hypothetical protein
MLEIEDRIPTVTVFKGESSYAKGPAAADAYGGWQK